ncbi:DUF4383 domain-containing protein [Streptomyces sp. NPDC012438]|uniref:DUF4383 domain-containing protein n=1 Tax=Streptomyces sp. NPDC012438 TaxID=3364833 RepID=UPI0036E15BB0
MTTHGPSSRNAGTPVQKAAPAVGAVFLLVGVLGFVPGVTTHYDTMEFAAHHSEAKLPGVFQVSVLHDTVHLLFGVAGLALTRSAGTARDYLVVGGAVHLVLWLYGMFIDHDSAANFVPVDTADNWLHFFLGIGVIALGLLLGRDTTGRARPAGQPTPPVCAPRSR